MYDDPVATIVATPDLPQGEGVLDAALEVVRRTYPGDGYAVQGETAPDKYPGYVLYVTRRSDVLPDPCEECLVPHPRDAEHLPSEFELSGTKIFFRVDRITSLTSDS